jgi:hypothetical protein
MVRPAPLIYKHFEPRPFLGHVNSLTSGAEFCPGGKHSVDKIGLEMYCCALELNGIRFMLKVWVLKVKPKFVPGVGCRHSANFRVVEGV